MVAKRKTSPPSTDADGDRRVARTSRKRNAKPARVAALIVAADQARRISATVRGALAIPAVDLVLVIDDGSTDNTQELARMAGAVVVRHSHHRGRAAALETGVSVAGMRDEPGRMGRHLLILDGGLGNSAVGAAPLVPPVVAGVTDLAIALTDPASTGRSPGMAAALARKAIERASGWKPSQPLSRIRCISREALEAALPLSRGSGLDPGMTLDVLLSGHTATEVECDIRVKPPAAGLRTPVMRSSRYRDVLVAINARRIRSGFEATQSAVDGRILRRKLEEDE